MRGMGISPAGDVHPGLGISIYECVHPGLGFRIKAVL